MIVTWLVSRETAAISAYFLCTPYNHAPIYSVIQTHIRRVLVCLAVTFHMHFWKTDQIFYVSMLLDVTWLVLRETAAISEYVLCTPYNHAPTYSVIRSHIRREGACVFSCNLPHVLLAD